MGTLLAGVIDDSKMLLDTALKDGSVYSLSVAQHIWSQKFLSETTKKDVVAVDLETKEVTSIFESIKVGIIEHVANVRSVIQFFAQLELKYPEKAEKCSGRLVAAFYDGVLSALRTKLNQLQNRLILIESEDTDLETKLAKKIFVGRVAFYLSESLSGILDRLDLDETNSNLPTRPMESLADLRKSLFDIFLESTTGLMSSASAAEYFSRTLNETEWSTAGSAEIACNLSPYAARYMFALVRKLNNSLGMSANELAVSRIMTSIHSDILGAFEAFLKEDEENILRIHESRAMQLYLDFFIMTKVTGAYANSEKHELKREELSRRIMEFVCWRNIVAPRQ
jgi:hypothetical protein